MARLRLTPQKREFFVLFTQASSNARDIARLLVLSSETVRSHLKNLYRKLEVRTREEAVEAAGHMRELV